MGRLIEVDTLEKFISEKGCIVGDDHKLLVANYNDDKWDEVFSIIETTSDVEVAIAKLKELKNKYTTLFCSADNTMTVREYAAKEQALDLVIKIILEDMVS